MAVAPVLATAIAAVSIFKRPAPLGIWKSIAPSARSTVRVPLLKLTFVFAPSRAIVWSAKVNSLRPITPVLIASPSRRLSPTATWRGAAWGEPSFTSLTTCVTRASFNCAASKQLAVTMRQTSKARAKICALRAEEGERFFTGRLELQGQRYAAADVSDAVIEDTVI